MREQAYEKRLLDHPLHYKDALGSQGEEDKGRPQTEGKNHLSRFNECALKRLKIELTFLAPHHKTCHYK